MDPVLPDGSPEIVFNLSDRFRILRDDGSIDLQPRAILAGQMTRHITIGPSGDVDLFGVKFLPTGAYGLLGVPLRDSSDRITALSDLWAIDEPLLYERLAEANSFWERITFFENFLAARIEAARSDDLEFKFAVGRIVESKGLVRIGDLAAEIGWSERRLERRFQERVGLTPKMFARVRRFQGLLSLLDANPACDLAFAALECGYYDQPHMNREFAAFAGTSPGGYLNSDNRLSEIFVSSE